MFTNNSATKIILTKIHAPHFDDKHFRTSLGKSSNVSLLWQQALAPYRILKMMGTRTYITSTGGKISRINTSSKAFCCQHSNFLMEHSERQRVQGLKQVINNFLTSPFISSTYSRRKPNCNGSSEYFFRLNRKTLQFLLISPPVPPVQEKLMCFLVPLIWKK